MLLYRQWRSVAVTCSGVCASVWGRACVCRWKLEFLLWISMESFPALHSTPVFLCVHFRFFFKDIRLKGTVVPFFFFSVRCLKKKKEKKCITQIQVGDRFDSPIQSTVNVATSPRLRSPLWRSRFNRCYCTFAPNWKAGYRDTGRRLEIFNRMPNEVVTEFIFFLQQNICKGSESFCLMSRR